MFHTILLCSDGSEDALHAARLAAAVARPLGASIIVLNTFDVAAITASYAAAPEALACAEVVIKAAQEAQQDILSRTSAVLTQAGIACRTRADMGPPIDTIVTVAQAEKADMIVLGSHGLSGVKQFLLGSVSHGVAHYAHCPVLVVRGQTTGIQQILLAFDGSEASVHATRAAASLAQSLQASLMVLSVYEQGKPFAGLSEKDLSPEAYAQQIEQVMSQRVEEALQRTGVDYRFQQEHGHPVEAITQFAAANNVDLVVMGSRGLGGGRAIAVGQHLQRRTQPRPLSCSYRSLMPPASILGFF